MEIEETGERLRIEICSLTDAGRALYVRNVLMDELELASRTSRRPWARKILAHERGRTSRVGG